jgi:N-acetylglucosaminyl-diphospho-decaprenol L-rhamnosyltransferase
VSPAACTPEASVLMVGYRTRDELDRSLSSLFAGSHGFDLEVILVDNASGDGTVNHVRRTFPQVRLVPLEKNIGFGRAVNLAASLARGEYLVLLNPDTVVRPGAVEALVRHARAHPGAGLVGGRTLTEDGRTEPMSCWGRPTLWSTFCFATGLSTAFRGHPRFDPEALGGWDRDTPREVGIISGCLLAVSASTWCELGGFDPRFFMYGEDTDLSLRARKAGYRPVITPAAEVVHTIGASSAPTNRRVMIMTGKVTIFRLHWPATSARAGVAMLAAGVGLRAALDKVVKRVRGGISLEQESWIGAWRRRQEWLAGYPSYEGPRPTLEPIAALPVDAG